MGLLELLVLLAVIGFLAYIITLIPMPPPFQSVIIGVAILVCILIVLRAIGFDIAVPRVR